MVSGNSVCLKLIWQAQVFWLYKSHALAKSQHQHSQDWQLLEAGCKHQRQLLSQKKSTPFYEATSLPLHIFECLCNLQLFILTHCRMLFSRLAARDPLNFVAPANFPAASENNHLHWHLSALQVALFFAAASDLTAALINAASTVKSCHYSNGITHIVLPSN